VIVCHINRVAKVVKGAAASVSRARLVATEGRVGFGHGKAREVPEAIRKATDAAKRALIRVPLREGRTLHHTSRRHGAGASCCARRPRTGIIAGGPMRAVFETLGVHDVVAKSQGSSNPYNMIGRLRRARREDSRAPSPRAARSRFRPCSRGAGHRRRSRRRVRGASNDDDQNHHRRADRERHGRPIGNASPHRPGPDSDRAAPDSRDTPSCAA